MPWHGWMFAALYFLRYTAWAPLTPLIFAAVRRFPFRRAGLARSIAIHACIALLCVVFVEALCDQLAWPVINAVMPGRVSISYSVSNFLSGGAGAEGRTKEFTTRDHAVSP